MDYPPIHLAPAERAVMRLYVQHKTRKEIAKELGKGPGTVNTQIQNAFSKMFVHSRAEAIAVWKQMQDADNAAA